MLLLLLLLRYYIYSTQVIVIVVAPMKTIVDVRVSQAHHQRVLKTGVLLNQEHGLQRLAEEPLTLFRDVACGVSAAAPPLARRARRRRWGGRAPAVLKPTYE